MKTAAHIRLGQAGEKQACDYLHQKGYSILQTNYVFQKAEIDIIAEKSGEIIFAEVKTRRSGYFALPELAVGKKKQLNMQRAAEAWMQEKNLSCSVRFDIISIVQQPPEIFHIEDAFFPIQFI